MSDPKEIWLEPACEKCESQEREWSRKKLLAQRMPRPRLQAGTRGRAVHFRSRR